jgi:peptidoglycan glycosyltransferase
MMELVVADGSGTAAQIDGRARRRARPAPRSRGEGQDPHVWFIGYAPADDPQVAVAVVIEDGGSLGASATGGRLAAPIARDVMRAVLGR